MSLSSEHFLPVHRTPGNQQTRFPCKHKSFRGYMDNYRKV